MKSNDANSNKILNDCANLNYYIDQYTNVLENIDNDGRIKIDNDLLYQFNNIRKEFEDYKRNAEYLEAADVNLEKYMYRTIDMVANRIDEFERNIEGFHYLNRITPISSYWSPIRDKYTKKSEDKTRTEKYRKYHKYDKKALSKNAFINCNSTDDMRNRAIGHIMSCICSSNASIEEDVALNIATKLFDSIVDLITYGNPDLDIHEAYKETLYLSISIVADILFKEFGEEKN